MINGRFKLKAGNLNKKTLIIDVIITLAIMLLVPAVSGEVLLGSVRVIFRDESEEYFSYINASNNTEYGKIAGERFPTLFGVLDAVAGDMNSSEEKEIADVFSNLSEEFQEELEGLAESLDLTINRTIYLIKTFDYFLPFGEQECTTTASTESATFEPLHKSEETTFLTENYDWPRCRPLRNLLIRISGWFPFIARIRLMGYYRYAYWGIPVTFEQPFLNAKGLALGMNGNIYDMNEIEIEKSGIPTYWLFKWSMKKCKNIAEVKTLWDNADRSFNPGGFWPKRNDGMNSMWADKDGNILCIEQTHDNFTGVEGDDTDTTGTKEDILWHANHHQWLDPSETGSVTDDESSNKRADRAKELLENEHTKITIDICKNTITPDHKNDDPDKGEQNDICRHGSEPLKGFATQYVWIINPRNKWVWVAHGHPCKRKFWPRDYGLRFYDFPSSKQTIKGCYTDYLNGHYYQTGVLPYVLERSKKSNYYLSQYENDEDYIKNLLINAYLTDLMTWHGDTQVSYDQIVSYAVKAKASNDEIYLNFSFEPDAIVDTGLPVDDPTNNTWTTIQKAVDNVSTLGIVVVKGGNYPENVFINKSVILFGENTSNVTINGTITMVNPRDYELINEIEGFAGVNMSGVELLLHFNNDSDVGENYSNSTVVYDYSGLENNGTNNGNVSWTMSTIKGVGAFDFNGVNSSIGFSSIPALAEENVTVSAWINWIDSLGTYDTILSQSNSTYGYCLYVNNTNGIPIFSLDDTKVVSSVNLINGWHSVVGTHNETTLKIYVDGKLTGSITKSGSGLDTCCCIGFDNNCNYFNGSIDEVAVWNRTLSGEEVELIYDFHYGVNIDGFTIQNSGGVGLTPVNHTSITNTVLVNHITGVFLDNVSDVRVQCNISDCEIGIKINNSSPDSANNIMDGYIENVTKGVIADNSSNFGLFRTIIDYNCLGMYFNNSNFNAIDVVDCIGVGNSGPDTPGLSGPTLGDPGVSYTYSTCTNDSDNDQLLYLIDWGDGYDSGWVGPYGSNVTVNASHTWTEQGGYYVRVKAKDIYYNESDFSEILFKTETLPPLINSVNNTPDIVGFGSNVTITACVTDDESGNYSGIASVKVNITYPDSDTGNHTMHSIGDDTYEYLFTDIWLVGQYNYTVWVVDNAYNTNSSTGHSFNVSSQANITVATLKDGYGGNEQILLTDPQNNDSSSIGYELLDSGGVLHLWNRFDHYYFNATNGIQMTNHYNEYWSHNVLMLGYYNNDQWNVIYRTDELSGFNKFITTDNESYVNITLWKNLEYQGYDFRLAIRYYLGVDDNELTVIPYIKNLGDSIPFDLGFGWELKDIQVDMTTTGDYINVNQSICYLNQTLNNTYTDLSEAEFYLMENITNNKTKSLYLKWNDSLTYKLQAKSREGQYNAPVTLFVRIGTLDSGQSKQTKMYWYDADQVTYYFNSYDNRESWAANPGNMVDGSIYTVASTTTDSQVELCNGNSCPGEDLGTISKLELRAHGYHSSDQRDIILRPVFGGTSDGNNYNFQATTTASWSSWFNIENPTGWQWSSVANLDCDVEAGTGMLPFTLYVSKVEIRVTFNTAPVISNPAPVDNSVGVSPSPVLNVTVSDANGDLMNITWYTNSTPNSLILRPDSNGSVSQLERIPGDLSANYMCVDEETVNDSDYVKWKGSTWKKDTYALSNHTGETGNIHFVKVVALCARVGSTDYPQTNSSANITLKSGGSYFYGKPFKPTYNITDPAVYSDYSYTWTFNPATGSPWNWSDIDNLEAGISLIGNEGTSRCSNIFVEVNYTNSSAQWTAFGSNNSVGNGTYHQTFSNASLNGRWWYWKVLVHDGTTGVYSNVCRFYTGYESKIENTGSYNISGYLLIQVQWYNSSNSKWVVADDTVNETTPRIINIGEQFGLDTVFNGLLDTNDLSSYGNGTYRVYAAFRDSNGDVLICNDETELEAMYEFEITFD